MIELQLEGLVGPTHNYAGLSFGNVASAVHAKSISRPRDAALQSLAKMKRLHELGVPVAVMPPHPRPDLSILTRLGYSGDPADMLQQVWSDSPSLAAAIWSASSMWTANAGTISPSCDTEDGRMHVTPANLFGTLHRSFEPRYTYRLLKRIFGDAQYFDVHEPLNVTTRLADEGAANHMRLSNGYAKGLHLFVYGATPASPHLPEQFPARQQRAASEEIAKQHLLDLKQTIYIQQLPDAIDAGVFHNDVIAMSHHALLICHERAFVDQEAVLETLRQKTSVQPLQIRVIREAELPLADAVATYFFNAQLISLPDGGTHILFPHECAGHPAASALCQRLIQECEAVKSVEYINLRESMKNGGGPACLRLRVPLTETELSAMHQGVRFTPALYEQLGELVTRSYPEQLAPDDLRDHRVAQTLLGVHEQIIQLLGLEGV